jgi:branched-subunit amino acid transport protein
MAPLWLTLIAIGLLTFLIRLSFIALLGRWQPPALLERALRFVPPAVLSAIILPEMVVRDGSLALGLGNPRWIAGILAIFIAWRTRSPLLTIGVGFVGLLILQRLLG